MIIRERDIQVIVVNRYCKSRILKRGPGPFMDMIFSPTTLYVYTSSGWVGGDDSLIGSYNAWHPRQSCLIILT